MTTITGITESEVVIETNTNNFNFIDEIEHLSLEHESFTKTYVVGGRLALYELLGRILHVVNGLEQSLEKSVVLQDLRARLKNECGIKAQKNTSPIALIIRYITRTDRKTAHVYTRVIEAAVAQGIAPEQMPAFVEGAGGVERIRSLGVNRELRIDAEEEQRVRISLTEEYLSCRAELPLAAFEATEFLDQFNTSGATYAYFVCTRKGDGKFHVMSPLPSTAEFERVAIGHLSKMVCKDMSAAQQGVASLRRRANEVISSRRLLEATPIVGKS
jgi:hypothetical protein